MHEGPVFCLSSKGGFVLSGGHDGLVKMWELATFGQGGATGSYKHFDMGVDCVDGTCISQAVTPSIRSLCARVAEDSALALLVATVSNEVYELEWTKAGEKRVRAVVQGHGGYDLQGLAMHPIKDWFATVGDDCVVRIWDMTTRACTHAVLLKDSGGVPVGGKALCFRGKVDRPILTQECPVCHYGTTEKEHTYHCDELAVGTVGGEVVILKMGDGGRLLECARKRYRTKPITCLQYSPNGTLLTVASDATMDVLLPDEDHRRVGVCKGHMAPICTIDWSEDGEYMQTSDTALELFFWSVSCMRVCTHLSVCLSVCLSV